MSKRAYAYRTILFSIILFVVSLILFQETTASEESAGGTGGGGGSADSGTKSYCISSDSSLSTDRQLATCPHYILGTIDQFKTAWTNKVGTYSSTATTSAYNFCTDSSKNTSGYVVFVGREYESDQAGSGFTEKLSLRNITATNGAYSSAAKWKAITPMPTACDAANESCTPNQYYQVYSTNAGTGNIPYAQSGCSRSCTYQSIRSQRDSYTYKSATSNSKYHIHGNFWNNTVPNWTPSWSSTYTTVPKSWYILYQQVMDDLNLTNDNTLAFFCPGMTGGTTTVQTATYSSTSTVQYGTQTGTSLSIESSTAISVSFYHTLKRTDSETSYTPSDQNVYYTYGANPANPSGTSSKVVPTTAGVKVGEETSVSVSPGSTVCRKIKYTPTSKSSNESTTAGPGSSEACITVTSPPPPPDVQTTASFQGYVSATSPDGKLSGNSSSGFVGDGVNTSYKIRFTYKLKRTDSQDPASATASYATAANANAYNAATYPTSGTNTITLGKNSSKTTLTYQDVDVSVPVDGSATACGYLAFDSTIGFTNGASPSPSFTGKKYLCVTFTNPKPAVITTASFSGSVTATSPDGKLSGSASSGFVGDGVNTSYTIRFSYYLNRTDSQDPSKATASYATAANASAYSASTYPSSGTSTKELVKTSGSTYLTYQDVPVTVALDGSATACGYISYDNSITYTDGASPNPSFNGRNYICVSFTNPKPVITVATFTGKVTAGSPDGKLSGDASSGFEGNGRDTSFKIRFYYYLNRTDSENPSSATVGYTYSAAQNADNSSSESSTITLGNNSGDTYLTYLDLTIPVSIGSSAAACGGILYNDTITYTNGSPTSYTTDYQSTCVSLSNPPVSDDANFSGESAVSQWSGLTYVSASGNDLEYTYYRDDLTVNPEKTLFPTTFAHKVKRIDSRDTPSTSITRWYSYRGSKDSEVYYDGGNSSALAKNSALSQVKSDLVNVPISLGDSGTYCQYITYDATVHHWTDGTITRSEYDGKSDPACLTINNPKYRTQTIVSRTDEITVSGSTNAPSVSGATLKTGTEYEANAKTIGVTFHHSLSRGADSYTSDSVSPTYAVRETRTSWNAGTSSLTGATVTLAAPSANWTSTSENGSTSSSATNLPAGSQVTFCHTISSITYGTYNITWYQDQKQAYYNDGTTESWENVGSEYRNDSGPVGVTVGSVSNEPCVTIKRPYNYKVDDISGSETKHGIGNLGESKIGYADDEMQVDFDISVKKQDTSKTYITDLDSDNTTLSVFGFAVDENVASTPTYVSNNGTSTASTPENICSTYYAGTNCSVLEMDQQPSSHVGTGVYDAPNADSTYSSNPPTYSTSTVHIPTNLSVGTKYCISMAIKNLSSSSTDSGKWFISKAVCVTIAKKPTLQVWGGGILAKGGIRASRSTKLSGSNKFLFGSWTDFALISQNEITGIASGAGLANGRQKPQFCEYSILTISNAPCETNSNTATLGSSNNSRAMGEYYNKIKDRFVSTKVNTRSPYQLGYGFNDTTYDFLSNTYGGTYSAYNGKIELRYKIKDDLTTINSKKILQVPSSTRLTDTNKFSTTHSFTSGVNAAINSYRNAAIFYSPEDIEITQNMLTQFNTSTLSDISIFIIIAEGNILIDERVEHLDAWIIAKGTVNTCSISGIGQQINSINSDTCTNQLTINGPVYAENLVLPRTYGSDQSKANGSGSLIDPAERINFTPSTLLWSYDQASKSNIPTTVYLKELSPRF